MSDESIINFHLNKRFKAKNYTNEKQDTILDNINQNILESKRNINNIKT